VNDFYKSYLLTGCYEILDNYNTFWFTLIALVLLHFLMTLFSLSLADLFRKFYAYDELLVDDSDKLNAYQSDELFRSRNSSNPNTPIDAYEMGAYYKNLKSQELSPPTYKVTRA